MRASSTKIIASRWNRPSAGVTLVLVVAPLLVGAASPDEPGDALPPHVAPPPVDPPAATASSPGARPAVTRTPRERSTVEMVRLDAGALYVRGDKLLGFGTRAGYHMLVGMIDLDVARFPHEHMGFEIHAHGGPIGFDENARVEIALAGAWLVAPLRWQGRAPGAFVLGLGGAFEFGRPAWFELPLHGAPYGLARLRVFPTETLGVQANYRYVPVTTDTLGELYLQEHDVELALSVGLLQVGARLRVDEARGGEPRRLYRSVGGGVFVGLVVY